MSQSRLPIALVTGFLGAGKTSFMRHLIEDSARRGLKVGVVINEFGIADVDSSLLRESGAEMLGALAGGCACCSSQDEMIWTMLNLGRLPRDARPDVVLLEASGLADPLVMLDALTTAALLPLVRVASLVCVIDVTRLLELKEKSGQIAPLLRRQVALADLVIVNKIDLIDGEKAARKTVAEAILREENATAQLEWARGGAIELEQFWQRILRPETALTAPGAGEAVHGEAQTLVVPLPEPLLREKLDLALQNLGEGVWRVKGFVRLVGENDVFLVQLSGAGGTGERQIEVSRFEALDLRRLPPAELVFIGPTLDKNALWQGFNGAPLL